MGRVRATDKWSSSLGQPAKKRNGKGLLAKRVAASVFCTGEKERGETEIRRKKNGGRGSNELEL